MVITKEEIRTLLNKLQNDKNCKYDFDYLVVLEYETYLYNHDKKGYELIYEIVDDEDRENEGVGN